MTQENDGKKQNKGMLVEDESVVGGKDAETGADKVSPKTSEGQADESTEPTDPRERKKEWEG